MARARLWLVSLALSACAGHAGPGAKPARAPDKAESTASDAFARLSAELARVPDRGEVLDALTPELRRAAQGIVDRLSAGERAELLRADGATAQAHPMFYLLAGGESPSALVALGTLGKGTADLSALAQTAGISEPARLLPVARELTHRAAARYLRLTAAKLSRASEVGVDACDAIDRSAQVLKLLRLSQRALELSVELEPSADRYLRLVDVTARELDLDAARAALARVRTAEWKQGNATLGLASAEKLVRDAGRAKKQLPANASDDALLEKARALADLGRLGDALDLLSPLETRLLGHAGLAATFARARMAALADQLCALTDAGSELARSCLGSLMEKPEMRRAIEILGRAWDSKRGRDRLAVETYVGLVQVLPLLGELVASGVTEPEKIGLRLAQKAAALESALADARAVAPELEGLRLYAEGIRHVFSKPGKDTLWHSPAERADFEAHAAEVAKRFGKEPYGQAGVTFAAALLAIDGNSAFLFQPLPADIEPSLSLSRAAVRLWAAVVENDSPGVGTAISELLQAMPTEARDPYTRGATILLAAEANFSALGSDLARKQLQDTAEKLMTPGWPPATRLRATIDRAGALSRSGDSARALELLEAVSETDAKAAPDWAATAKAYALVLKASAAKGAARKALVEQLAKVGGADAGRAFSVWRDMWVRELTFLSALDQCGKRQDCVRRAAKARAFPESELETRLGRWLAGLARRGTLSAGSFNIGLNYSTSTGLSASVDFSFALPAVEYPVN